MFKKLRTTAPFYEALYHASFITVIQLILAFGVFPEDEPLLLQKLLFVAALVFLSQDCIEGAAIARTRAGHSPSDSAMYAFSVGGFWGVAVMIMTWQTDIVTHGELVVQVVVWLSAAVFFGLTNTMMFKPDHIPDARRAYYDESSDLTGTRTGHYMYFGSPFVILMLIIVILVFPRANGWTVSNLWFALILSVTLLPRYPLQQRTALTLAPRAVGTVLLLIGLMFA